MSIPKTACAKGGAYTAKTSPAKAKWLATLHARRRGVPVHPKPPPELGALLKAHRQGARTESPQKNPASIRKIAEGLGVSDRTVRRWFQRIDLPAPSHHAAIIQLAKELSR